MLIFLLKTVPIDLNSDLEHKSTTYFIFCNVDIAKKSEIFVLLANNAIKISIITEFPTDKTFYFCFFIPVNQFISTTQIFSFVSKNILRKLNPTRQIFI
ncbi:hypothetical protein SDC9_203218 [bioreactor metagenome]|uniref:Uncharacterized protein n=1 Tax=bioreactor metagenome TaxID=1076179 RepID=A0A645J4Y0_9ZZZZ